MKKIKIFLGIMFLVILMGAFNCSCKTVHKTQSATSETATVSKSDSSYSKSYSYIDTTKTDSSTEITRTEITIDSVEWSDGLALGYSATTLLPGPDLSKGYNKIGVPTGKVKAKGIKVSTTIIKQAAIKENGVAIKADIKQTDINNDSSGAKAVVIKTSDKEGKNYAWLWLLIIPGIALVWWKRGWIIDKVVKFIT